MVTMLQVGDNGCRWRQCHDETEGMGQKAWDQVRSDWLAARAHAEQANRPAADKTADTLIDPGFVDRYLHFREPRLDEMKRLIGGDVGDESAADAFDTLTVMAILERIGQLGGHDFELARDIVTRLEAPDDESYANLEGIARWITRHRSPK